MAWRPCASAADRASPLSSNAPDRRSPTPALVTGALRARGALTAGAVASVFEVERFPSACGDVSRLALVYDAAAQGERPRTLIAKVGEGEAYDDVLRELRFFRQIAPSLERGPGPGLAPRLLGAAGALGDQRIVLLLEDLEAAGAARLGAPPDDAQLELVADTLAEWCGRWWGGAWPDGLDFSRPQSSVTRMAQAWPPSVVEANAAHVGLVIDAFLKAHGQALAPAERQLLRRLVGGWGSLMEARGRTPDQLTLSHGDLHLAGNVFFHAGGAPLRIIDWSEMKPGLPPHDLAYLLSGAPSPRRVRRDEVLLRRFHAAVPAYDWDLCVRDFRLSLLNNLLQSVLQGSLPWFRRSIDGVVAWQAAALLEELSGQNP